MRAGIRSAVASAGVTLALGLMAGCASAPPAANSDALAPAATSAAPAAPAATSAASVTSAPKAGAASASAAPSTKGTAAVPTARITATRTKSDGSRYTPVVKNGQTFYCANEEFTGSKVQKQVCLTETQYEAMQENKRQFIHQIQSQPLTQPAPSGSSGR